MISETVNKKKRLHQLIVTIKNAVSYAVMIFMLKLETNFLKFNLIVNYVLSKRAIKNASLNTLQSFKKI